MDEYGKGSEIKMEDSKLEPKNGGNDVKADKTEEVRREFAEQQDIADPAAAVLEEGRGVQERFTEEDVLIEDTAETIAKEAGKDSSELALTAAAQKEGADRFPSEEWNSEKVTIEDLGGKVEQEVHVVGKDSTESGTMEPSEDFLSLRQDLDSKSVEIGEGQGAVLYTGEYYYDGNYARAQQYAEEKGYATISDTEAGAFLEEELKTAELTDAEKKELWDSTSHRFASELPGEVHIFSSDPQSDSSFYLVEYPALQAHENVAEVSIIRPLDIHEKD